MRNVLFIYFILIFSLSVISEEVSKKKKNTEPDVSVSKPSIYAKDWSSNDTTIIYSGDVEIKFDQYQIYADYVEYDKKNRVITAKGRVSLSDGEMSISGEDLVFNLKTKSGTMYENNGNMPPSIIYSTKELNFINRDLIKFKKMDFSSCAQRVPRWKISCKNGKIKRDKYIEMKSAVLKIKNIPVFYFPYIRYPIRKGGKATGLLFPKFGTGSQKGLYIQNAFFLNLKSNLDLTVFSDFYEKAGFGIGGEFRYLFKNMSGNIKYYNFSYKDGNIIKPNGDTDYYLDIRHYSRFDLFDTKINVNVNTQSDPTFLRLFSNSFETSLFANFRTSFSLNSKISIFNVSLNASKRETYYTHRESSRIIKYMPSIKLSMYQKKIWKIPGYFSFKSSFERVSRSGVSYEDEPDFTDEFVSQRINFVPSYTLNLVKLPWLSTTLKLSSYQNFYPKSYAAGTKDIVSEPLHLGYNMAEVTLKGPIFYKIFNLSKGKIKHIIEPQINYKYSSQIDEEDLDRLIKVDRYDYPQYSVLGFNLNTSLLYKKGDTELTPREILRFSVSQKYYFDPALATRGRKINGVFPDFSELSSALRLSFFKNISLNFSLAYNFYLKKFQRINTTLLLSGKDSIVSGRIAYSSYVSPYMPIDFYFNRDMIIGAVDLKIPKFPVHLSTSVSYDITTNEFRYGSAIAKIDWQCMKFNFEFKVFSNNLGTYSQFRFGFSLGDMGMVSNIMGGGK